MPDRLRSTRIRFAALVAAFLVVPGSGQPTPAGASFPPFRVPRLADGHPDLDGIWQAFVTANWDVQDQEAQAGPHPELVGAYGALAPRRQAVAVLVVK